MLEKASRTHVRDTEKHMDTYNELNNHIGHMLEGIACGGERMGRVGSPARWAEIRIRNFLSPAFVLKCIH